MLKEFVWNAFEKTGNIDAYVFYKEIEKNHKVFQETKITENEVAISS